MPKKLKQYVSINESFKKSMNLKLDKGDLNFLEDFILSPSNQENLAHIVYSSQNDQGAFTFTGPYGSGKSSFALFLSELLAPTSQKSHTLCIEKITEPYLKETNYISFEKKRKLLSIIGEPISPLALLSKALKCEAEAEVILETLNAKISEEDGLILIIDEMGKMLESSAAAYQQDIYLFQQIAEMANSSNGSFIFIGILHQSFTEYSSTLSKKTQNEWYKIHGRFSDLVIDTSNEEKLDLIGKTILSEKKPNKADRLTTASISTIKKNRPINSKVYESLLLACWPLNPIIALMLGPLSLKDFAQNQRSIFSFLSSGEPSSFQRFLETTDFDEKNSYGIDEFWNYIKYNFDFLLSRSTDARRWILAQETLDKLHAQASITKISINSASTILKLISLLEIFKGTTGLVASKEIIQAIFHGREDQSSINETLNTLCDLSLIRESYDKSGYVLFDGSDFNIDAALNDAAQQVLSIDYSRLNNIASFQPIVAKKHYHDTGTTRWMELSLMPFKAWRDAASPADKFDNTKFGAWIILIPEDQSAYQEAKNSISTREDFDAKLPIVLSVTSHFELINTQARELLALEWIEKNTPNLLGDRIARQEIDNRKNYLSLALRESIASSKRELEWWTDSSLGQLDDTAMNRQTSILATNTFSKSPHLQAELLNNNKPSGSANGAANALLRRMVLSKFEERLGFEEGKYPAERGLYEILLAQTGIHQKHPDSDHYYFGSPSDPSLATLWTDTSDFLMSQDKCTLKQVYHFWEQTPYGIKKGLHSILFMSYLLSKEGNIASYLQGMYLPEITELFVDYLIKESSEIEIKYIEINESRQDYVKQLHKELSKSFRSFKYCQPNILDISRKMVAFINKLNPWVMRTKTLSRETMRLRDLLKGASDPNKLLFEDVVKLYGISLTSFENNNLTPIIKSLEELEGAYPELIQKIGKTLYTALQISPLSMDLESLHDRAKTVNHATGDFRIDALASRLSTFNPENDADIAGIASLAANKPIHDWIDLDVERATIELGVLCDGFKKAELYSHLKGKPSHRRSFVVMSSFNGEDIQQDIDFSLPSEANKSIKSIKEDIKNQLTEYKDDVNILRAALLELSLELSADKLGK